ncbi:Uncharacterised protein [Nocardia africana]|uniref:Uncharacterized protein n=1 Tax=Nocardia africana TaxID=134964 RepID=A0A378WQJ2_9NOCA|nr:Uncharacterised protein [Nocardia africana]
MTATVGIQCRARIRSGGIAAALSGRGHRGIGVACAAGNHDERPVYELIGHGLHAPA